MGIVFEAYYKGGPIIGSPWNQLESPLNFGSTHMHPSNSGSSFVALTILTPTSRLSHETQSGDYLCVP